MHSVWYVKCHISGLIAPIWVIFLAEIVISYMQIGFMMTRNVLGWTLGVKTLNNHQKLLGEKLSTLCNMKKYHNLGLSWPIWVIFVANMVISYVPIGFMMTRTSCSTFLRWAELAWKSISHSVTIRGQYYGIMEAWGTSKHQLFPIFLAFSESLHQMEPENACGAKKSQTFAK